MLRQTDDWQSRDTETRIKRRKKWAKEMKVTVAPSWVTDELSEYAMESMTIVKDLGHKELEVVWDDGCCVAFFCSDCRRWGHLAYDYQTDGEVWEEGGPEYSGELFGARCADKYESSIAAAVSANMRGRRMDGWTKPGDKA